MAGPFDLLGQGALGTGGGGGGGAGVVARAGDLYSRGLKVSAAALTGTDRAELHALVNAAVDAAGRLDIVVHNAGGCPWASIEDIDEDKLREALSLNLEACFWLTQAALPHMRKNRFGRILVTSSVSARVAMGGGSHYSAAKAGVNAFIRGAAFELARDGITVNGVEPGFIAKPGRGKMSEPETAKRIGAYVPLGHLGEADDVAYAMLYLASEQANYVTGQTIVVDGGLILPETGFAVERQWGLP